MALDLLAHADSIKTSFSKNDRIHQRVSVKKSVRISVIELLVARAASLGYELILEVVADSREADLNLCVRSPESTAKSFFPLITEQYAILIPRDNPLAFQSELSFSDLNGQALVERIHCDQRALFDDMCQLHKIQFPVVTRVETEEWAHSLVASSIGICFAPLPVDYVDPRFITRNIEETIGVTVPHREIGIQVHRVKDSRLKGLWENWSPCSH